MDINELQRFTGRGHEVVLMFNEYAEPHRAWSCGLQGSHDGTQLKTEGRGATPEEAVTEAARKFDRATFSGLPEMNPQLTYEAKAEPESASYEPNDVPF